MNFGRNSRGLVGIAGVYLCYWSGFPDSTTYTGGINRLVYLNGPRQRDGTGSTFTAFPQTDNPVASSPSSAVGCALLLVA
jgi:hypothetical protein